MGLHTGLLMLSEFAMQEIHVHSYPLFIPNEYLFTEYAKTLDGHEKMERWEVYALAVEDFIRR